MSLFKKSKKIFIPLLIAIPINANSGALAEQQLEDIKGMLEAHNEKTGIQIQEFITEPLPADSQACLDGLMGIDLDIFSVDPSGRWKKVAQKLRDEMMDMACDAASTAWNDAVTALEGSMQLPYDLGGITISATSSKSEWGVKDSSEFELSASEIDSFTKSVDEIGNVDTSDAPMDDTILDEVDVEDTWDKVKEINDDVKKALKDKFF
ncbi:MAG: hypothetical protein KZQ64_04710 [gamma proteobacterium symbiont of Bathyaustriella thionipta]|nr:hypothetical protein [gamma proteobacterium symbiont of Bathyaustriella thionipta]MCU7952681.1 hypothetical protein [gamma proteobacterium symbiont of Bathyaustriella thionipta]MCU7957365.1 hypothetical protein [gamma proteobacterium symbiont of Bathyaustriella thionipta]MCU7967269.1 hypothetical protein [gamma proteobacterium symbiont of Bathyaustriella thionipta]